MESLGSRHRNSPSLPTGLRVGVMAAQARGLAAAEADWGAQASDAPDGRCSFVVGDYNCPQQVGNRLFPVLNAELCARIIGVPLLWEPNEENGPFECDRFLTRRPGISRAANVTGCPRFDWPYPLGRWNATCLSHTFIGACSGRWRDHIPGQRRMLAHMSWKAHDVMVYCGRIERPLMGRYMAASARAPAAVRSRIEQTFQNGTLAAYGGAFRRLFEFAPASAAAARAALDSAGGEIAVGIHARLFLGAIRASGRAAELVAQMERLAIAHVDRDAGEADGADEKGKRACVVFVASDTLERTLPRLDTLGRRCRLVHMARTDATLDVETRRQIDGGHGNYKDMFIAEMDVLRRASLVIGTKDSSSSELVAALAIDRGNAAWECTPDRCTPMGDDAVNATARSVGPRRHPRFGHRGGMRPPGGARSKLKKATSVAEPQSKGGPSSLGADRPPATGSTISGFHWRYRGNRAARTQSSTVSE